MSHLTTAQRIDDDPEVWVRAAGTVLRTFDHHSQDSGNVSWLVESAGERLFVKTAGTTAPPPPGAPVPYLDHAGRVALLRNAVEVARSCDHPALPELLNVVESPAGPVLVYEAAEGELVHAPADRRHDPSSAYQRFAHLPGPVLLELLDTLVDTHAALAAAGWVAVDLYDGCLLVDLERATMRIVDLDTYRRGPSTNDMGRMFGASRFMAPEEFELGARIDQRTTVFNLGRIVWHFATRLTEDDARFCGDEGLARVVRKACSPSPGDRHASVADLSRAWSRARRP